MKVTHGSAGMDFGVLVEKKSIFSLKMSYFYVQHLTHSWKGPEYFKNLAQYFLHSLLALLFAKYDFLNVLNISVIIFNWRCDWCPIQFSREIPCSRIINRITNISLCKFYTRRFSVTLRFISNFLNCLFFINFSLLVTS